MLLTKKEQLIRQHLSIAKAVNTHQPFHTNKKEKPVLHKALPFPAYGKVLSFLTYVTNSPSKPELHRKKKGTGFPLVGGNDKGGRHSFFLFCHSFFSVIPSESRNPCH